MKNVCAQHLCINNCQQNKKPKQQMFCCRDGMPRGNDNEGKPRETHRLNLFSKCLGFLCFGDGVLDMLILSELA